jgi:tetratricopeptide (TPR) repeat protein
MSVALLLLSKPITGETPEQADAAFKIAAAQAQQQNDGGLAMARVWSEFGQRYVGQGRFSESEVLLRRALTFFDTSREATRLELAAAQHNLAITSRHLRKFEASLFLHRAAVETIEQAYGLNHAALVLPLTFLGAQLLELGRGKEAEPLLNRAIRIGLQVGDANSSGFVTASTALAELHQQRGDFAAARRIATRALHAVEKAADDVKTAPILHELARIELGMGRYARAAGLWSRTLAIYRKHTPPGHPDTLIVLTHLGEVARLQRRYGDAEKFLLEAVQTADRSGAKDVLAISMYQLGLLNFDSGRHREAERLLRRGLELTEVTVGRNLQWVSCAADLSLALARMKRYAEAESQIRPAVATLEQVAGKDHPWLAGMLSDHVSILRKLKRKTEADQVKRRLRALEASGKIHALTHSVSVDELYSAQKVPNQ